MIRIINLNKFKQSYNNKSKVKLIMANYCNRIISNSRNSLRLMKKIINNKSNNIKMHNFNYKIKSNN